MGFLATNNTRRNLLRIMNSNLDPMWVRLRLDEGWVQTTLKIGEKTFAAYCREGGSLNDDHPFIRKHLAAVMSDGGLILRHEHDWKITEETIDYWGNRGYKLDPVGTDIWYFPECTFEESLRLPALFGFPIKKECPNPAMALELSIALIRNLAQDRKIAIIDVRSKSLNIELVQGSDFTTEEMTRLLEFNEAHFRVKREKWEFLEYRKMFRQKSFFLLGAM
jgi:hypothetical protein